MLGDPPGLEYLGSRSGGWRHHERSRKELGSFGILLTEKTDRRRQLGTDGCPHETSHDVPRRNSITDWVGRWSPVQVIGFGLHRPRGNGRLAKQLARGNNWRPLGLVALAMNGTPLKWEGEPQNTE